MSPYTSTMHYLARGAIREDANRLRKSLAFWRTRERFMRRGLARLGDGDEMPLAREYNRGGAVAAASKIMRLRHLLRVIACVITQAVVALCDLLNAISEPVLTTVLPIGARDPLAREHAAHGPPTRGLAALQPRTVNI